MLHQAREQSMLEVVLDRKIKSLPVKGFWLILVNETMSFILPAIVAIGARYWLGPIGWPTWDDTSRFWSSPSSSCWSVMAILRFFKSNEIEKRYSVNCKV